MIEKAISKIRSEMEQKANNPYFKVIGDFLVKHLQNNPGDAEKVVAQDKTIEKSLTEMKKEAEKKKVGNCAVITDEEGFAIILKYFRLSKSDVVNEVQASKSSQAEESNQKQQDKSFSISLDDLF